MLARLLLLDSAYLALVMGEHVTCSWQPKANSTPAEWPGPWNKFCTAQHTGAPGPAHNGGDVRNVYKCAHLFEDRDVIPATWDVVSRLTLNFETPCGDGGWFVEEHDWCPAARFALTVGSVSYGIGKKDDCEFPDKYEPGKVPQSVDVWYLDEKGQ